MRRGKGAGDVRTPSSSNDPWVVLKLEGCSSDSPVPCLQMDVTQQRMALGGKGLFHSFCWVVSALGNLIEEAWERYAASACCLPIVPAVLIHISSWGRRPQELDSGFKSGPCHSAVIRVDVAVAPSQTSVVARSSWKSGSPSTTRPIPGQLPRPLVSPRIHCSEGPSRRGPYHTNWESWLSSRARGSSRG